MSNYKKKLKEYLKTHDSLSYRKWCELKNEIVFADDNETCIRCDHYYDCLRPNSTSVCIKYL